MRMPGVGRWLGSLALAGSLAIGLGLALGGSPDRVAADSATDRIVEQTNQERRKAGLPPLTVNASLTRSAQAYAEILAQGTCWNHNCGPIPTVAERNEAAGYLNWAAVGENLGAGSANPDDLMAAWMKSDVHRGNILGPDFTEIGVAVVQGGPQVAYWVQEFGARKPAAPAESQVFPVTPVEPAPAPVTVTTDATREVEIPESDQTIVIIWE
jgi:hypothetical protein